MEDDSLSVELIDRDGRFASDGRRAFLDDPVDEQIMLDLLSTHTSARDSYARYRASIAAYRAPPRTPDPLIDAIDDLLATAGVLACGSFVFRPDEKLTTIGLEVAIALYARCEQMCEEALCLLDMPEHVRVGDQRPWELEQKLAKRVWPEMDRIAEILRKKGAAIEGGTDREAEPGACPRSSSQM